MVSYRSFSGVEVVIRCSSFLWTLDGAPVFANKWLLEMQSWEPVILLTALFIKKSHAFFCRIFWHAYKEKVYRGIEIGSRKCVHGYLRLCADCFIWLPFILRYSLSLNVVTLLFLSFLYIHSLTVVSRSCGPGAGLSYAVCFLVT